MTFNAHGVTVKAFNTDPGMGPQCALHWNEIIEHKQHANEQDKQEG